MPAVSKTLDRSDTAIADRRRWTSFLTWAFVLAEVAARDGFLPNAAYAGDETSGRPSHAGHDSSPIANNLPNIDVSTATESPQPVTYQQAASSPPLPAPTPVDGELADTNAHAADGSAHEVVIGGGGGGAGFEVIGHPADAGASSDASIHVSLGQFLTALDQHGEPLDLGLHLDLGNLDLGQTVHNLLGGVADGLGNLPLVGGALGGVSNALADTTGNLSSLDNVVSIGGASSAHPAYGSSFGLVDSSRLDFATGPSSLPSELATADGAHTNFGIALNIGVGDMAHAQVDLGGAISSALDTILSDHLAGDLGASDALHHDQSLLRTAADALT